MAELYARIAKDAEAERLRQTPGARVFPCLHATEDGLVSLVLDEKPVELVVANPRIALEPTVRLDLRRVLGIADIRVQGAAY